MHINDQPAKGNWLLPPDDGHSTMPKKHHGSLFETNTILFVIILSTVSVFLATVLIGAIMCMLKPCKCRGDSTQGNGTAYKKGRLRTDGLTRSDRNYPTETVTDHSMGLLNCNGYMNTLDGHTTQRGLVVAPVPIPGLDQLYLPHDKVIGVEPISSGTHGGPMQTDTQWYVPSTPSSLIGSGAMDRLSPTGQFCHYAISHPPEQGWMITNVRVSVRNEDAHAVFFSSI